jgi:hypothetical protein
MFNTFSRARYVLPSLSFRTVSTAVRWLLALAPIDALAFCLAMVSTSIICAHATCSRQRFAFGSARERSLLS